MDKGPLNQFKAAAWKSQAEIEAFIAEVGQLTPPDALKLLEVLTGRGMATDVQRQRMRCVAFGRLASALEHKGLFKHYLAALKLKDTLLRSTLVSLLPRVNNLAEHGEVIALLGSADVELRKVGSQVLRAVAGKSTLERLKQAVEHPDFAGKIEAVDAMVGSAGKQAIPLLEIVIRVGKPAERLHALKFLADAAFVGGWTEEALRAAEPALKSKNNEVLAAAIAAFGAHCDEDDWFDQLAPALDHESIKVVEAAVRSLQRFNSLRCIAALERKLRAGPGSVRFAVLDTLEAIGSDEVLSALVDALGHKQIIVRTRAGEVLSKLSQAGKLDISRTVIWLLRSRDAEVRRMAVELARSVKDPDGTLWPKMLSALRDEDWWVRERVTDALIDMAGNRLTRHIVTYLQDPSDLLRRFAVDVLAKLKDPQALGALVRTASADDDWWVRERAVEAIAELDDARAVPYLVDLLGRDEELRFAVLGALGKMGARATAPQVAALLADPSVDIRRAALETTAKLNDPAQAPHVQALLRDESPKLRSMAERLLRHWNVAAELRGGTTLELSAPALDRLLLAVARSGADDVIIAANRKPMVKRHGVVLPLSEDVLTEEQVKELILPHLSESQLEDIKGRREVDLSYEVKLEGLRWRANVFLQVCGLSAVFRIIKGSLPRFETLGLPKVVQSFGDKPHGLILVGGPTGSGKSTTLAALIDYINRTSPKHIVSLEDPIEVVHERRRSLVNQREIGTHTKSFTNALRATMREDPDVILVGEMRDLSTIAFAVSAAETGHLVFGTVHTVSADNTVDRIINAFPSGQQEQVRSMVSESLQAVLCQYLLKGLDGKSRYLASEVMINNDAIGSLIRKGKSYQIPSVIMTSSEQGMQLMDQDLLRLYKERKVSADEVFMKARDKKEFEALFAAEAEAAAPGREGASERLVVPGAPGSDEPGVGSTEPPRNPAGGLRVS